MIPYAVLTISSLAILGSLILSFRLLGIEDPRTRIRGLAVAFALPMLLALVPAEAIIRACAAFFADVMAFASSQKGGRIFQLLIYSGVVYALLRLSLAFWHQRRIIRRCTPLELQVQTRIRPLLERTAHKLGLAPPTLLGYPQGFNAWTLGLRRPRILLSSGLIDLLDEEEMEGVIAHEMAHIVRRDNWSKWVILGLRSLFFYLPTSLVIPRLLADEQEKACDDLAVRVTGKPLAFAEALIKIWKHRRPRWSLAPHPAFLFTRESIERRVRRLIEPAGRPASRRNNFLIVFSSVFIGIIAMMVTMEGFAHTLPINASAQHSCCRSVAESESGFQGVAC